MTEERRVYQWPPQMRAWLDSHAGQVCSISLPVSADKLKHQTFDTGISHCSVSVTSTVAKEAREASHFCWERGQFARSPAVFKETEETCAISSLFHTLKCHRCYLVVNFFFCRFTFLFHFDLSFSFSLDRELILISKLYQQLIEIQERFLEDVLHEIRNIQIKTVR